MDQSPCFFLSRGVCDTAMFERTESDHKEQKNISIVVENEQELYTSLSPEDEFNDSVKSYIRSKITGGGMKRYVGLTVISRTPIDEDRFRSAVSNWARDEKEALDKGLLKIIGNKEVDDDYIAMIKTLAQRPELLAARGKDLKIVYTPLHGSGNVPVQRLLKELGVNYTVVPEQEKPDGHFPTVKAPNPEDPNAFTLAIPLAQKVGATVVFGTDPDCDRLGAAVQDGNGVFHTLTGNQIACLMLSHILSSKKANGTLPANGAVVKSVVSTELARAIAEDYGMTMIEVLTGFKFIGEQIQRFEETGEHTFLFGFEESFGYLSGTQVRDKDGVNASLLLCEAVCAAAERGETLYDTLQKLYQKYGYFKEKGVSVTLPGKDGVAKIAGIMNNLRENPPKEVAGLKITGIRDFSKGIRCANGKEEKLDYPKSNVLYYEIENGNWICVRPSGTEPKIKLYVAARADSQAAVDALNDKMAADAQEWMK